MMPIACFGQALRYCGHVMLSRSRRNPSSTPAKALRCFPRPAPAHAHRGVARHQPSRPLARLEPVHLPRPTPARAPRHTPGHRGPHNPQPGQPLHAAQRPPGSAGQPHHPGPHRRAARQRPPDVRHRRLLPAHVAGALHQRRLPHRLRHGRHRRHRQPHLTAGRPTRLSPRTPRA